MRDERYVRILAVTALVVAVVAALMAGRALMIQRDNERQIEALGDLIRQFAATGRPIMDMGPPGGRLPQIDRGE